MQRKQDGIWSAILYFLYGKCWPVSPSWELMCEIFTKIVVKFYELFLWSEWPKEASVIFLLFDLWTFAKFSILSKLKCFCSFLKFEGKFWKDLETIVISEMIFKNNIIYTGCPRKFVPRLSEDCDKAAKCPCHNFSWCCFLDVQFKFTTIPVKIRPEMKEP